MKAIFSIVIFLMISGCELITIGSKAPERIEINQNSAVGAVYLFKTELDSNNIPAATRILAKDNANKYLAIEKYDLYFEIHRLRRLISYKPITEIKTDTLSNDQFIVDVWFDYIRKITFTTSKIDSNWYILNYKEEKLTFF